MRIRRRGATGLIILGAWLSMIAPAHAYTIVNEWHWSSNPSVGVLPYCFSNGTNDIASNGERESVKAAAAIWNAAMPRVRITEVGSCVFSVFQIKWVTGAHGDSQYFEGVNSGTGWAYDLPFGFSPGTYAHAFPPNNGDIHFDDGETWTMSERPFGSGQPIDLQTVALHELGHMLGLGDSESETAIMYDSYVGSHRYLSADDIAGVQAMYTDIR